MKLTRLLISGLALMSLTGCAHRQKTTEPKIDQQKAPDLGIAGFKMLHLCFGRAMHASGIPSGNAEADKKIYFENYFEAFLDAKEQAKYVACLEEDREDKDYSRNHREAEKWLQSSREEAARYKTLFPPEKQITDVEEKFTDISDKRGARRVVITLMDGTQTVSESQFDKTTH